MAPIALKIKGNKSSFSPFLNVDSEDELSKTWRVCTKVKDALENGSRLENLSWRLWFVHNVGSAKSRDQLKRTSTTRSKLDKDRGKASTCRKSKASGSDKEEKTTLTAAAEKSINEPSKQCTPAAVPSSATPPAENPLQKELEYRRMLRQQQQRQCQQNLQTSNAVSTTSQTAPFVDNGYNMVYQPQPQRTDSLPMDNYVVPPFTSDQAGDQTVQLDNVVLAPDNSSIFQWTDTGPAAANEKTTNDHHVTLNFYTHNNGPIAQQNSNITNPATTTDVYNMNQTQIIMDSNIAFPPSAVAAHHSVPNSPALFIDPQTNNNSVPQFDQQLHNYHQSGIHSQWNGTAALETLLLDSLLDNTALYVSDHSVSPSVLPNGTLYNKLLATLPRETLESAERLLLPKNDPLAPLQQQQQLRSEMHQHVPVNPGICEQTLLQAPSNNNNSNNSSDVMTSSFKGQARIQFSSQPDDDRPKRKEKEKSFPTVRRGLPVNASSTGTENEMPICSNCSTTQTPLWRRSNDDKLLCNACGL